MVFGLFKRTYEGWQLPEFNIMDSHLIVQAIQERDSFVRADDVLTGPGSLGKYVFYESNDDFLFVFRMPLANFMNVYVHKRGDDGKFGKEDGIEIAQISLSSYKPEDHDVTYVKKGWWIQDMNGLFSYLINEMKQEDHYHFRHKIDVDKLRKLERDSKEKLSQIHELFRDK
ncbi:hypothetical protein FLK61_40820 [Paenalkalicoccus suaedae]|uniref:Uncharacterized protein n=1 Tax=Paenalkalicoccus suaedae TaxID=2592382 RepID=A0A859FJF9_9BACI|nr:hypothetical protein [Paenalkalicoccus suaedae]QKS72945.1 hypothetical protein FLK61_40820 [Paenalkalicoccus suaedae]